MWPAATTTAALTDVVVPTTRTVLVIEDEDIRGCVDMRLTEDLGTAAVTASDGIAGIEMVAERTIDAVLVDLTMPRMNGADVVAALRAKRPELPIVLCTGYDRDRKGPVEANAYLPKPFRIEALEATLAKLLRDR